MTTLSGLEYGSTHLRIRTEMTQMMISVATLVLGLIRATPATGDAIEHIT